LVPVKSANDGRVAADAASRESIVQSACSINWLIDASHRKVTDLCRNKTQALGLPRTWDDR
jgi:hypothetical protein